MHDRANFWPHLCVATFGAWNHSCKLPLAFRSGEAAWALAIRDCKDLAWALTRGWALSIPAAKTSTLPGAYPGVGACLGHYGNMNL